MALLILTACGQTPPTATPSPAPTATATLAPVTPTPTIAPAPTTAVSTTATTSAATVPVTPSVAPPDKNKVLAEFADVRVTFGDYLRYRQFYAFRDLFFYEVFFTKTSLNQTQIAQIKLLEDQLHDLPNMPVDQNKLKEYLQALILVREAKNEFGIVATQDEIDQEIANQLGPVQIYKPYELDATATAGVVYTAASAIDLATIKAITPLPSMLPFLTPTPAPTPSAVPSPAATAIYRQQTFFDSMNSVTGLTRDDYRKFEAEPNVVSRKLDQRLRGQLPKIGDPSPQIRFSQILVTAEADAQAIYKDLLATPAGQLNDKFVKLAREKSIETFSAERDGDVGWVISLMVDSNVWNAVSAMAPQQLTNPIQTDYGWLIAYVTGKDLKRPLDAIQYEYIAGFSAGKSLLYDDWLKNKIQAANVKFYV